MKKKLGLFGFLILAMSCFVTAGNIAIDNSTFEDGSNDYNGSAIIDSDTLEGYDADYFIDADNNLSNYVTTRSSAWSTDRVGGGMSSTYMKKYLFNDFVDWLKGLFATKSDVAELKDRLDYFEAKELGLNKDEFQVKMAKDCVERTGKTCSYGQYTCFVDGVCFY